MSTDQDYTSDEIGEVSEIIAAAKARIDEFAERAALERELAKNMRPRFEENIKAFTKYLPDIAKEFRHYKPGALKFFCSPTGVANIVEEKSGNPLYGDDPIEQCRKQVERNIDEPKYTSLLFNADEDSADTFIHSKYMHKIYRTYLDATEELEPINHIPEHLGSMIMFGIGLGYHLPILLEKITIDHLYICEPYTDWFFASLYTCDWKYVLETVDKRDGIIHIRLGVNYEQFTADFINECKDKGAFNATNAVLYQHYPSSELTRIISEFSHDFHMVSIGWGFFDDAVISIAHDYANAQLKVPMLKYPNILPTKWRNTPAFVVANGPSIDDSIDYIRENRDDIVLFSCGSVIKTLFDLDIMPDFHVELERTRFTYDYLKEFIDEEKMSQINFLTLNVMHPKTVELFKWSGMAFKPAEASTIIASDFIDRQQTFAQMRYSNPVVANTALAFACYLGFREIYLFGVDNGYVDPEHHHSKHSLYYTKDGKEKKAIGNLVRAGEVIVEGNFGKNVTSTAFLNTGRYYLGHLLSCFPKANCYNCSDGAKIDNTYPVPPEDLLIEPFKGDKEELIEFIKNEFFQERDFDEENYNYWLAIDQFDEIVDGMIKFTDREFKSRAELATALKLQVRYLFSFALTRYRHLYFTLEGSITYVHSVFRQVLYGFADEQETLKVMHRVLGMFHEYMREAKKKFRRVLAEVDEQDCYLMALFKEGLEQDDE